LRFARSPVAPNTTMVWATGVCGAGPVAIAAMIRPDMDRSTIDVYEARAAEWRDRRPARFTERAEQFAAAVPNDATRADLGCGPGLYLPYLGRPVVALDAAGAMLELTRGAAPDAGLVQADVEALPLRRGSLGGAWARATYLHIARPQLPAALADLHQALRVGGPVQLTMRRGDDHGLLGGDDFPGRFFAGWQPEPLRDVLVGAGFSVDELTEEFGGEWLHVRATRLRTLPDFVGPGLRVLVVGLNPSEYAADAGVGFARPGNRFWPAAINAGLVSRDRDPRHALHHHQVGMTDLVKRATPGAATLTRQEYRDGLERVGRLVRWLQPRVVCFAGLTGWRAARDSKARAGVQADRFDGAAAYVMPNPSGVNAHASLDDFVDHFRRVQRLADGG
jgi:double-stranded uracil-DNA glycosylase